MKNGNGYLGGIVMFGIMFVIALASLYVFKKFRAGAATTSDPKGACMGAGGVWTGDKNPEDPCCYEATGPLPASVPKCLGP